MSQIVRFPLLVLALAFVTLWLSAKLGATLRRRRHPEEVEREDFDVIVAGTMTLLALIIGFSFSMASSRYRSTQEPRGVRGRAQSVRSTSGQTFCPPDDAAKARSLLRNYLDQRISFYETRNDRQLRQIAATTAQLEAALWSTVRVPAEAQPTPVITTAVTGMNDVLNSKGHTQAAWLNRIPIAAWGLMTAIAICCNLLVGYGAHRGEAKAMLLLVLPLVVSISFALIANIDSPRGGIVRVHPQNLTSLSQSLREN